MPSVIRGPAQWYLRRPDFFALHLQGIYHAPNCFEYERAFEVDPDLPQARKALARIALERGDQQAAVEHLRIVLDKAPGDSEARELLSRAQMS